MTPIYAKKYLAAGSKDNQTDGVLVKGLIPYLVQRLKKTRILMFLSGMILLSPIQLNEKIPPTGTP